MHLVASLLACNLRPGSARPEAISKLKHMAFSPFEGGRGDETFPQHPGSFIPLTALKANLVVFFPEPWIGVVPLSFLAPGLGVCSFFARPKKEPKKGRSFALPLRGKRLRFMGFNRFERLPLRLLLHSKRLTP